MGNRIEVLSKIGDARADLIKNELNNSGVRVEEVSLADVYTTGDDFSSVELDKVAEMLTNPVFQKSGVNLGLSPDVFEYAVEIGFHPGVTDNVGSTARECTEDLLGRKIEGQGVYSSQTLFLSGISKDDVLRVGDVLLNPLINRVHVKSNSEFVSGGGMDAIEPIVRLGDAPKSGLVDILNADDIELQRIGKMGIYDHDEPISKEKYQSLSEVWSEKELMLGDLFKRDGEFFKKVRRGPLALSLDYMHTIQGYFSGLGRNPTDVELESIAQTWSEHCKHTIFADPIDDVTEGLFNRYIKGATEMIRTRKGSQDICVSVFTDNAGVIKFDDKNYITLKVETHNSPSALDPFGGSITGIVGVNRDPMGTGLGSKPFLNISGPFCFADPDKLIDLYKGAGFTQKMLSSRQIMDGVINGVNVGGNCSGIPTSHFRLLFNDRYRGKPLVYVGTFGVMPRKVNDEESYLKKAQPGDLVVMLGGRVGKDGIHGATFSSEAMDTGSPVTAVQIGDPITQKKMSDALIKEARDRGLYTSITDDGAGGLSCSVAEMAKESGGCYVKLDDVPLKYPGLSPWETWISESQERMTLSVPQEKWEEFNELMVSRGVEATVIGEFTNSGKCVVDYNSDRVMDVYMDFLHDGLPKKQLNTTYTHKIFEEPKFECLDDLTDDLLSMLGRKNIASFEFISKQYDHEVQGGSVIKPIQGRGRVCGDATVTRPVLDSKKGVAVSQGVNPSYSEISPYDMAACAIDSAIRNIIAVGGSLDKIVLLDNFCWCSSDEEERLGQLKLACEACYDYSVEYGTPFVSGKDSMFNDFKGFDENGNSVKISVPPTLTVTSTAIMEDSRKAVSQDVKIARDLVYILGETHDELGGSEYFSMKGEEERGEAYIGNCVPEVNASGNIKVYRSLFNAIDQGLVASCQSVSIGGLGVALAKTSIGGKLGLDISLNELPGDSSRNDYDLFSESQGRFVVSINPDDKDQFEKIMNGNSYSEVGVVRSDDKFIINNCGRKPVVDTNVENLERSYKSTFKDY